MTSASGFDGLPVPASLLLSRRPEFDVFDQNGVPIKIDDSFDPRIDPIAMVHPRDTNALIKWGEQHASSILTDETLPLWQRQLFMHRGLVLETARLYEHRARFARLQPLIEVLRASADFLARHPETYVAVLSMTPAVYQPAPHAVGTGLLAAALLSATSPDGNVPAEVLMAPLLAGLVADIGLVESHRDLLSFEQPMTPPERNILHAHPHASSRVVQHLGIGSERLLSAVEHHHERIDGSGYPLALGHPAVPHLAQCVGAADAYLTLVTKRRREGSIATIPAVDEMATGAFAPALVEVLRRLPGADSREGRRAARAVRWATSA